MNTVETINKLILTGSLMAEQLRVTADELDRSSGIEPNRPERTLPHA